MCSFWKNRFCIQSYPKSFNSGGWWTLTNQWVPHLVLFHDITFWQTNPEMYTNFEEERAPKKRDFLSTFSKSPKTAFLARFFVTAGNLVKIGSLTKFKRAQKIFVIDLKKGCQNFEPLPLSRKN